MSRVIKYFLILINTILMVCGGLLIALGSVIVIAMDDFEPFSGTLTAATLVILVIILGFLIVLVSCIGSCAVLKEHNRTPTLVYTLLTLILICLEIALIVWISVQFNGFLDSMSAMVKWAWQNNTDIFGNPMVVLETNFDCCGLNGYKDYTSQNESVPSACCPAGESCSLDEYQSVSGCEEKFTQIWTKYLNMMRYGCVGVVVVQMFTLLLSCFMARGQRKSIN